MKETGSRLTLNLKRLLPWIVLWFAFYAALAFVFAYAYFHTYRGDNATFSIANNPYNQALVRQVYLRGTIADTEAALVDLGGQLNLDKSDFFAGKIQIEDSADVGRASVSLYGTSNDWRTIADGKAATTAFEEKLRSYESAAELYLEGWNDLGLYRSYKDKEGYIDFLYFSIVTFTTVGYGDMVPNSTVVRALTIFEMACFLFLTLFGIKVIEEV